METLLSLTSKRAGEWFKEELRVLGGVDHIVRTIQDCAARLDTPVESWSTTDVEVLRKADRCLRVLENVSSNRCIGCLLFVRQFIQGYFILSLRKKTLKGQVIDE